MINYQTSKIKDLINKNRGKVVLFGAGTIGSLTLASLKSIGVNVDYFCDSDPRKQNKYIEDKKIISPEELYKFEKNTNVGGDAVCWVA